MSKTVTCLDCGKPKDVPAYPGDGVYTTHVCDKDDVARTTARWHAKNDPPEEEFADEEDA